MSNLTDEALARLVEIDSDKSIESRRWVTMGRDDFASLVREVQALRAKVKEQQEALDEWYPPRVGEREEARD